MRSPEIHYRSSIHPKGDGVILSFHHIFPAHGESGYKIHIPTKMCKDLLSMLPEEIGRTDHVEVRRVDLDCFHVKSLKPGRPIPSFHLDVHDLERGLVKAK